MARSTAKSPVILPGQRLARVSDVRSRSNLTKTAHKLHSRNKFTICACVSSNPADSVRECPLAGIALHRKVPPRETWSVSVHQRRVFVPFCHVHSFVSLVNELQRCVTLSRASSSSQGILSSYFSSFHLIIVRSEQRRKCLRYVCKMTS